MGRRVAVVGAGVVGLFTALRLARAGFEVEVYEEREPGSGATGANANVIHLLQPPPGKLRRRLALKGARLHRVYSRELGYRLAEARLVVTALTRAEELALHIIRGAAGKLLGVESRVVKGPRVLDLEPSLSERVRSALVVEGYGVVDSREVVGRLLKELDGLGVDVKAGYRVDTISKGPCLAGAWGSRCYDYVVNSAGVDSARLASAVGDFFDVKPVPGAMEDLRAPRGPRSIVARPPLSLRPESKGGAVVPQLNGLYRLGPSYGLSLEKVRRRLLEALSPDVKWEAVGKLVGYRAVSKGRDFIVARGSKEPRVVHLVGIESPGLTAAPALAELVARMLAGRG